MLSPTAVLIDAGTRPIALLGDPVAHSLSPLIHNTGFRTQGLNYVYLACRVPSEALSEAIAGLRALGFAGANVTIPHKEAVVPLLDRCTPRAQAIGAVNTIVCLTNVQGKTELLGDNTDVEGFLAPLRLFLPSLEGGEAVVFGAGGAARAVVYALLTHMHPSRLTLLVRNLQRGEALATDMAPYDSRKALRVVAYADGRSKVRTAHLIVNATPVGMHPHDEETPWPHAEDFSAGQLVYDLIYNPLQTRLLREAAARGAITLGGLAMLLGQAAAAYKEWTGQDFPFEAVRAVLQSSPGS